MEGPHSDSVGESLAPGCQTRIKSNATQSATPSTPTKPPNHESHPLTYLNPRISRLIPNNRAAFLRCVLIFDGGQALASPLRQPLRSLPRAAGARHGAIEPMLVVLGVRVHKVNGTVDDLSGANRCPVDQVTRVLDSEPRGIGAVGAEVEAGARQHGCARQEGAIEDDGGGPGRETDNIIGVRFEFENHGAG